MSDKCPICKSPLHSDSIARLVNDMCLKYFNCARCGEYSINSDLASDIEYDNNTTIQIANISGWIRESQNPTIYYDDYQQLLELKTLTVAEKAEKLFRYLVEEYPVAGMPIKIHPDMLGGITQDMNRTDLPPERVTRIKSLLPLLSISWSCDGNEFRYIMEEYLWKEKGFISLEPGKNITPKGWAYWDSLKYINVDSQFTFIAMWFDPCMDTTLSVFEESVLNAGYKPVRVDNTDHLNNINDEILSLIRQSKFLLADFTGQRDGVYFESGYAQGLGIKVLWLCHEDDKDNLHFDTDHNNYIFWNECEPKELIEKIQFRIERNFGKGKYSPKEQ